MTNALKITKYLSVVNIILSLVLIALTVVVVYNYPTIGNNTNKQVFPQETVQSVSASDIEDCEFCDFETLICINLCE